MRPAQVQPKAVRKKVNRHVPPMSAQHFFFIADVLASIETERPSKKVIVERMANQLALTNPNFRRDFFIEACFRSKETN